MDNILVATKSPGKCLICGGYLILNNRNKGIVLNVDAFIRCESFLLTIVNAKDICKDDWERNWMIHCDISTDYTELQWKFTFEVNFVTNEITLKEGDPEANKWIYNAMLFSWFVFILISSKEEIEVFRKVFTKNMLKINIVSDYRFYSYSKATVNKSTKTGLGSSSALLSSLTSNIMISFNKIVHPNDTLGSNIRDIQSEQFKSSIVIAAILANNKAQNKIGSGFDIMSSLLGNQIFQKYPQEWQFHEPLIISQENKEHLRSYLQNYSMYIQGIKPVLWNTKELTIALVSMESGSDTRIFVKKVLEYADKVKVKEWFDDNLFGELNAVNNEIINFFVENTGNPVNPELKHLCLKYRQLLQLITKETKIEIEPNIFTDFLSTLLNQNDIVYAICPGAGGYDSICVLGYSGPSLTKTLTTWINCFNSKQSKHKAYLISANITNAGTEII